MRPSQDSSRDKKHKELRSEFRAQVVEEIALRAEVRCSNGTIWQATAINLSQNGVLLQFPEGKVPPVRAEEKISVKLHCKDDIVWLPGVVRHRYADRFGVFFAKTVDPKAMATEHTLSRILRVVERGWLRKRAL